MGRTYRKSDNDWEFKRKKEERKREKLAKKREFIDEREVYRKDDEARETDRRR